MKLRRLFRVAALPTLFFSLTLTSQAQTWTELKVGDFTDLGFFSGGTANLSDGRLVLGAQGSVYVQRTFGAEVMTPVANPDNPSTPANDPISFDPSFVAVRNDTNALLGAGGIGASGLHNFNPATPTQAIKTTALATLQNFQGVYWNNPVTKRNGWLVVGIDTTSSRNQLSYISIDGAKMGSIIADVSQFSAGLAVDSSGNVYIARADFDENAEESNNVYKFNAAQIDDVVAGILAPTPVPSTLSLDDGSFLYQPTGASGLAVDSWGRVYATGSDPDTFLPTGNIEIYDPASDTTRTITPRSAALPGAGTPSIGLIPSTFKRKGQSYIAWLAYDGGFTPAEGADIIYGYALDSSLDVTPPAVGFTVDSQSVTEAAGTVNVQVTLSHRSVTSLTVPLTVSGTSTSADRSNPPVSITIPAGTTTATIPIKITNDKVDEPVDLETCILTLTAPSSSDRYTLSAGFEVHTLSIADINKPVPAAPASFTYAAGAVGSNYSVIFSDVSPDTFVQPITFKATGLPPGLTINAATGEISGTPNTAGRYENIIITATNAAGSFRIGPYVIDIAGINPALQGTWVALVDRAGTVTGDADNGLGARLDFTITRNASVTGRLLIGTQSFSFKSQLDTTAGANAINVSIPRRGLTPLEVTLALDALALTVNGSVSDGGPAPASLSGWRAFWSSTNTPVARLGTHNVALKNASFEPAATEPEGVSYASLKVDAAGRVSVAGRSADGNALTGSAPLGRSGEALLYQALYKGLGSMSAAMFIGDDVPHSVSGTAQWSKKAQAGSKLYAAGWPAPLNLTVQGGLYTAPTTNLLLDANAAGAVTTPNAELFFEGANVEASTTSGDADVRLLSGGKVSLLGVTAPNVVKLSTVPSSGLVTGSFLASMANIKPATVSFYALVIPDFATPTNPFDGTAEGNFILGQTDGTQRAGSVTLQKLP